MRQKYYCRMRFSLNSRSIPMASIRSLPIIMSYVLRLVLSSTYISHLMRRCAWNSGKRNLHVHFFVVLKVPAFVFHVVFFVCRCGICARREPFTRVAPQPESKRTLIFFTCFGLVGFLRTYNHPMAMVDPCVRLVFFLLPSSCAVDV